MVSQEKIRRLAGTLVERFHPDRVVLMGSYARGDADEDSDVDLMVVMPLGARSRLAWQVDMHLALAGSGIAKDILLLTPQEFAETKDIPGTMAYPAAHEGVVLHAG